MFICYQLTYIPNTCKVKRKYAFNPTEVTLEMQDDTLEKGCRDAYKSESPKEETPQSNHVNS